MTRRERWRQVLDSEVKRWSALPYRQLLSELRDLQAYEVQLDSRSYQVEVEILENNANHLLVAVSVDDGSLPASIFPSSEVFVCPKPLPSEESQAGQAS